MPPSPKYYNVDIKNSVTKAYSYEIGRLSLRFSLNLDDNKSLKGFKILLEKALNDVTNDLGEDDNI